MKPDPAQTTSVEAQHAETDRVLIARLRVALRHAIEELEDMVPYVPEYFREKWGYDDTIAALKITSLECDLSDGSTCDTEPD